MVRITLAVLTLFFCINSSFARNSHCGTIQFFQQKNELRTNPSSGILARTTIADNECTADDYYDSVYTRKTEHFQFFYTLNGPHKTTKAYIDSLEVIAEYAWNFHTKNMGMLAPKGSKQTLHYQQEVSDGLYPIEVLDIENFRYSSFRCRGCYGVTFPDDYQAGASNLVLDNDFLFTPSFNREKSSVNFNGKTCSYTKASEDLRNDLHDYSYAEQWSKALRVTVIHELYHSVQLRYVELNHYNLFWFEASASGMEELAAPDIDDYYSYLPNMFSLMGSALDGMLEHYGVGIFFLYLYNHLDKQSDKIIWENFGKQPDQNFRHHLNELGKKKKISVDSLFHDFSKRLAFAGKKSQFLDSKKWITSDQYLWPDFNYIAPRKSNDDFIPNATEFAYEFYINGHPNLEEFKGKASIVLFKNDKVEIQDISSIEHLESAYMGASANPSVDSVGWIFSNLTSANYMPLGETKDYPLHAYPTPWRSGNLCFTPLPENSNFIEIRNRRGDLIFKESYYSRTHCIDETTVRNLMVPGVYRFRAGNSGKLKDFLIIY
ncbi:MAG: hypothetical protein MJZ25_10295 [Fibrobacter sp.]|nr:hypothetical protein [Fibrobacter sp.]